MNTLPEAQIRSVIPDLSRRKPWSRSLNGATRPSQRRSNIRRWIWDTDAPKRPQPAGQSGF